MDTMNLIGHKGSSIPIRCICIGGVTHEALFLTSPGWMFFLASPEPNHTFPWSLASRTQLSCLLYICRGNRLACEGEVVVSSIGCECMGMSEFSDERCVPGCEDLGLRGFHRWRHREGIQKKSFCAAENDNC